MDSKSPLCDTLNVWKSCPSRLAGSGSIATIIFHSSMRGIEARFIVCQKLLCWVLINICEEFLSPLLDGKWSVTPPPNLVGKGTYIFGSWYSWDRQHSGRVVGVVASQREWCQILLPDAKIMEDEQWWCQSGPNRQIGWVALLSFHQ